MSHHYAKLIREKFTCLSELADITDLWQQVASRYDVVGKQAHDARIAAFMLAHGVTFILTLNPTDFARYSSITAVTPQKVIEP